ncbi:MAG TPA: AraC family transcriptional regulator [Verrucomicrobiae bacterium]|nr:AraC family transcriptional regulator [Verrucomicrobiae bacterium]
MKSETPSFYRYFPVSRRDKNWGLYATTAGETRVASHTEYPPSGHPKGFAFDWRHGRILEGFALIYISSGGGTLESRPQVSARIEAGNAFLLFPGVWHRYAPHSQIGWHEHWIGFDGEMARRWLRHGFFSPNNPVVKIGAEDTVLATFSRVMQAIRANRPALQQILAGATQNLMGLFYSAQQALSAVDVQNANVIERAITRIQDDFGRALDMKRLAQELGVSYSGFRHTFTEHTGLSPHQYLLELRLVRARSLLSETELPVKEIALQTGFEDELYFSRLFRQKLNLTPSQWRKRSRHSK